MIENVAIKNFAEFINTGKTPPTKNEKYFNGELDWFTPGDLDNGKILGKSQRTLTKLALEEKKAISYPPGTLLVGCIGNIGKIGITAKECSSNQQITGIKPNSNVDVEYLYYWFKGNRKTVQHYSNNAVVPILNNRTLEKIKIPLPPLPVQQKITAILDAAEALKQKDKALIAKYDELTQSLFLDMFDDPVTNPKGWVFQKFDELVSHDCPLTYGIVQPGDEYKDGIPVVRPVDLTSQYINIDGLKKINPAISSKYKRTMLGGFELLLSVRGSVGEISCAVPEIKGANVTRGIVPIWMNKEKMLNSFVYYLFKTDRMLTTVKSLSKGATLIQLNLKDLRELKVIAPAIDLQNQFTEHVQAIEQQKQQAQASLQKSADLFNCLLQKAFKGELVC